jgi:tetratricopeptide (TPR) repeat protein
MRQSGPVPRSGEIQVPLESTVGRALDAARVVDALSRARIGCITGPLGVGKSHLARQVAWALADRFAGGAHVCDVAIARTEAEVASLLEALRIPPGPALLVVDGADACGPALAALLPRWLGQSAGRTLLVTARQRTGLPGEVSIPLEPLAPADAVGLFVDRAQALNDRFTPSEAERRAIGEIVRRVDCLPLGVVLCAAQTLVLRPEALLAHLRSADARLDAAADEGSLRQAARAAFELLPADVKPVLVACAVFSGAFTYEAAVAVAGGSLAALMSLCRRSFVQPLDDDGGRRFRLYGPIRDFAAGLGLDPGLRARHRDWYLQRLERGEDLDAARRNLLASAALDLDAGDAARALDTLVAVTPRVLAQGPVVDALALLTRAWPAEPTPEANHAAGSLHLLHGRFDRAAALLDAALAGWPPDAPQVAATLAERANAARLMGQAADATALYGQALVHPHVPPAVAARTLERLAGHLFEQGARENARARFDEAGEAYAALDDAHGRARVQHALGLLEQEEGHRSAAAALFRDAQARHAALGDERFAAIAQFDEGALLLEDDAVAAARRVLQEAVERLEALGDRRQAALGEALLGVCEARLGDRETARDRLARALADADAMGDVAMSAAIRVHHGHVDATRAAALARLPETTASDEERYAVRLLEQTLRAAGETLVIAADGAWVQVPDGTRVEVKSQAARRILVALLEARTRGADAACTAQALFRRGWPGERVLDHAARNRLQVALSALRKAGLGERLVRLEAGYALSGPVRVAAE